MRTRANRLPKLLFASFRSLSGFGVCSQDGLGAGIRRWTSLPRHPPRNRRLRPSLPEPVFDPLHASKSLEVGTFYMKSGNYDAAIDRFKDAAQLAAETGASRTLCWARPTRRRATPTAP